MKRKDLLETMLEELPQGSVRFSSKVVSIEKSGLFKLIHLADGAILKTKVYYVPPKLATFQNVFLPVEYLAEFASLMLVTNCLLFSLE